MGLFRQAAVDARKRVVIGNHLIPPSRHLTCLVWLSCGVWCFFKYLNPFHSSSFC